LKKGRELTSVVLDKGPRLIIGRRNSNKMLEGFRIQFLASELTASLAELCNPSLDKIRSFDERPWENFASLDEEEYFWFPHTAIPTPTKKRKVEAGNPDIPIRTEHTTELLKLIKNADGWPYANQNELAEGKFTFYVICWNVGDKIIGFVSHINPVSTLKSGFKYFQYGNSMTKIEVPDFALRSDSDLVIGITGTAIFNKSAFISLFGDVGISFTEVSQDVTNLKGALSSTIKLSKKGEESLTKRSSKTQKYARRLKLLPARLQAIELDATKLRKILTKFEIDHALILDKNEFSFEEKNIDIFFDVLESRYFKDEFSPEERKADRFSTRK